MHLLATPLARAIRLPVLTRYWATRPATQTRPWAIKRSVTTPRAAPTRPTEGSPSLATPPASRTRPWVVSRSPITPTVAPTRPWALVRSLSTPLATAIRPPVLTHSRAIPPAEQYGHGWQALQSNTTGNGNTAVGSQALHALSDNAVNSFNTAIGFQALLSNTFGVWNTAIGSGRSLTTPPVSTIRPVGIWSRLGRHDRESRNLYRRQR